MSLKTPERSSRCDARMLKRDDKLVCLPSHGENRGSSPLGSANDFSNLAPKRSLVWPASPTFLQWTVLQTIGSRSRCDRRLEEAGSDLRHRRAGIGAKDAYAPHRGAAPWSKLNMRASCSAFAHVGGLPPSRKSSRGGAKKSITSVSSRNHASCSVPPGMTTTSHLPADPLFAAEAEFHLAFEHPHDLLICVTVRLDMDAGPDAPPYDHSLVAGENAAADLFADPLLR